MSKRNPRRDSGDPYALECDPSENRTQAGAGVPFDVTETLRRAVRGQVPLRPQSRKAMFGDFTVTELEDAYSRIDQAEESFMDLPPKVREHFRNDPVQLLEWIEKEQPDETAFEKLAKGTIPGAPEDRPSGANATPAPTPAPPAEKPDTGD